MTTTSAATIASNCITSTTPYVTDYGALKWNDSSATTISDCVSNIVTSSSIKDYIDDYINEEKKVEKAPKEATNILFIEGNSVKVKNCKDGEVKDIKTIMSDIKDIEVKYNGKNSTVIFVTFKDGKTEKAVLDKNDEFSLEHGLTIILLEKLLSDKGVDGKSVHNKLVNRALKIYNKQEKEKADKAKKEADEKAKKKRLEEKLRAKKQKQAKAEREYKIEMQKEAYIRAMKELEKQVQYFVLVFEDDNDTDINSLCVRGYRKPSIAEAKEFWKDECESSFPDREIIDIYQISKERAYAEFCMENEEKWHTLV